MARWRLGLLESDFDVVHCAGVKQQVTDALSCARTGERNTKILEHELPVIAVFGQGQAQTDVWKKNPTKKTPIVNVKVPTKRTPAYLQCSC